MGTSVNKIPTRICTTPNIQHKGFRWHFWDALLECVRTLLPQISTVCWMLRIKKDFYVTLPKISDGMRTSKQVVIERSV
jgi:hypothetical protein